MTPSSVPTATASGLLHLRSFLWPGLHTRTWCLRCLPLCSQHCPSWCHIPHHHLTNSGACVRRRYNVTRAHMVQLCEAIIALGYQFIVLDCPAGIDVGFINAISPAKEALIVTTPEITSIR